MPSKYPTDEQVKEFWQWCGKPVIYDARPYHLFYCIETEGNHSTPLEKSINLNNLFKYAVPKLQDKGYQIDIVCHEQNSFTVGIFNVIKEDGIYGNIKHKDLALALFWAIWDVMNA